MTKPRVILADTDADYLLPLQYKFVNDFFDRINLEIITDRNYFEELFAKPQKADILIVSNNLYDGSLRKHNIDNIFLMTDEYGRDVSDEYGVKRLYKYTSIKEIFQEITGRSSALLNTADGEKRGTRIIVVTSASGGTGKTTIAMGLSACLTKSYKRVLYMNAANLQVFQYMLDNQTAILESDAYARLLDPTERIYEDIRHVLRKEIFTYIPAFKASLMSIGLSGSVYGTLALSAQKSGDFDYIIVDAESVFDENKAKLLDIADQVIVVLEQSTGAVQAVNAFLSNISGINSDKYIFCCNKFEKTRCNALISPDIELKFTVNEYIEKFEGNGDIKCEELSQNAEIKKVMLWVS